MRHRFRALSLRETGSRLAWNTPGWEERAVSSRYFHGLLAPSYSWNLSSWKRRISSASSSPVKGTRSRRGGREPTPLGGERRPRRRLVRELADREEEEAGGLQPRERLGGVRLGLHLIELELARCAAVVAQVARAAHLVEVSAQEGAQVGLRQLAARAEQLVQVVPAVVRA